MVLLAAGASEDMSERRQAMTHKGEDLTPQPAAPASALPSDAPAPSRRPPAAETVRLYASDWAAFVAWCHEAQPSPLPAAPDTITAYLTSVAATLSHGTLMRRLAAIADQHRQHGLAAPAIGPAGKALLRVVRAAAVRRRRPRPASGLLARMAATCPGDLAGLRDRALLLLAAATGLGRTALVNLDMEHIRFTTAGLELTIPYYPDAAGRKRSITVHRGVSLASCPGRALEDWLRSSNTSFGPVFRKVDRWGNVEHRRLGADAIRRILARRSTRRILRADEARA
jgi:integrase